METADRDGDFSRFFSVNSGEASAQYGHWRIVTHTFLDNNCVL
jgi:hypothetical protein